jgi:putative radical SAM enzyme (TIGR03279 family)
MKAEIAGVMLESIGAELGWEKGDYLISLNGRVPQDFIDYRFMLAEEFIDVEIEKANGSRMIFEIEKEEDEDLGLIFAQDTFDGVKRCKNKCIFCFVDQMPPDLRDSLYVKDDDYRLSLIYGNFITMTNLTEKDLQRIIQLHISPLYISIHTIDPALRQRMLNNPNAGEILDKISYLAEAGIEMHTQVVLCPGVNDGKHLAETATGLKNYWPQVKTVAIVPVGITKYQKNGFLRPYTKEEAQEIVRYISSIQQEFRQEIDTNFVFLSDEFYLMAEQEIPSYDHYEDFAQIENGVGLVRFLWSDFDREAALMPPRIRSSRKIYFVTGISGEKVLAPITRRLNQIENLKVEIIALENKFFGNKVTVAGLLTGSDLISGLKSWRHEINHIPDIFLSSAMLKQEENLFLDDMTVQQVEEQLNCRLHIVEPLGKSIVAAINSIMGFVAE